MSEKLIQVVEYATFDEAFNAAKATKESFSGFQMGSKLSLMRQHGKRFFVDNEYKLWYTTISDDGARFLHQATVYSMLSDGLFRYVQLMVWEGKGNLRFSDQYCDRSGAIQNSKSAEVMSFYK